jgi:hypothetical protein
MDVAASHLGKVFPQDLGHVSDAASRLKARHRRQRLVVAQDMLD